MQKQLNEIQVDLSQLVTMSAELVRANQQQTRNLEILAQRMEIQTQQIGGMSESITVLCLTTEAQGQRIEQGLDRMERALEAQGQRMDQGFARMDQNSAQTNQNIERLCQITQAQGQQMLEIVQQLAQVVDRLVPEQDR